MRSSRRLALLQIKRCLRMQSAQTCLLLPYKKKGVISHSMMIRGFLLLSNSPLKSLLKRRLSYKDISRMRNDHCHRITNNSTLWSMKNIMRTHSFVRITPNRTAISLRTSGTLIPTKEELGLHSWTHRLLINLIPTDPRLLIQGLHQDKILQGIHQKAHLRKTT